MPVPPPVEHHAYRLRGRVSVPHARTAQASLPAAQARAHSRHRVAVDALVIVLAVAAALVAFSMAAHGRVAVGPALVDVSVAPAFSSRTVVELPPIGSVEAPTHVGPVRLTLRLHELDIKKTASMVKTTDMSLPSTITPKMATAVPGLSKLIWRVLGGGLLASVVTAAAVVMVLRRRRWVVLLAVGLALLVPAGSLGIAAATWDVAAFRAPTLHGDLSYAPELMEVFSTRVASVERLREQAADVARKLAAYYSDDRSLAAGGALSGTYRVVHITDMHLDPVGAELAQSIARSYEASLVINTGDMPILGVPIEDQVLASLVDTSVPHAYIPGNHDSPASLAALTRLGVTVLTTGTTDVGGLRILPVPDPLSRGVGVESGEQLTGRASRTALSLMREELRSGEATPEVVAVHHPDAEEPFIGTVGVILSGHTHSARMYVSDGTVRLNSGTVGGMPYDPEKTDRETLPYSASVLYFTQDRPHRLIAVDRIEVSPKRSTTVTRDVIDEALLESLGP